MNSFHLSPDLCPDVMSEILSRVSLKTLSKCRLLSTEYNKLTYNSSFMRLHSQRANTLVGFFIQTLFHSRDYSTFLSIDNNPGLPPILSFDFLPNFKTKILATDKGLVYCVGQFSEEGYICKPSTKQWEHIPTPDPRFFTIKTGLIVLGSNPLRFKIVRVSQPDVQYEPEYQLLHCQVFDSETWAWNQLNDLVLPYHAYLFNHKPAICARGGLHWLMSNGTKNSILSFYHDNDKERWEFVSLPNSLCQGDGDRFTVNLAEYEGKLALICLKDAINILELWVLNDYGKERVWGRKQSVDLSEVRKEIGHYSAQAFYNADIVLVLGMYNAIFHNFKTGRFHRLELPSKFKYAESTFFVHTDYEPVIFRQPRAVAALLEESELFKVTTSLSIIPVILSVLFFLVFFF